MNTSEPNLRTILKNTLDLILSKIKKKLVSWKTDLQNNIKLD